MARRLISETAFQHLLSLEIGIVLGVQANFLTPRTPTIVGSETTQKTKSKVSRKRSNSRNKSGGLEKIGVEPVESGATRKAESIAS